MAAARATAGWAGLFLALLLSILSAAARAETVALSPGAGAELTPHLVFGSDPAADLATMLERYREGAFGPELKIRRMDSNFAPEAWAAVDIVNETLDDGRPPDPFVLTLDLPAVSQVDLYLVRGDGVTENLLAYSIFAPFDAGQHTVTRLRSPRIEIAAGERVTLLAHFAFGPFLRFDMALRTPSELEASAFVQGIRLTAFYAGAVVCLLLLVGFFVAMRDWISLFYAAQFLTGLALIAFLDGLLFRFLYPAHPEWQSAVGFLLLYLLSGIGFLLAGHALAGGGARRWARGVRALALLSLGGYLYSLAAPGTYAGNLAYLLFGLAVTAEVVSNREWRARHGGTNAVARVLGVATLAGLVTVVALLLLGHEAIRLPGAIRAIYLILLVATVADFAAQVLHIRRLHAEAVAGKVAALEAEAKRSQELLEAERAYSRARDLARQRQRQLATASHDFRQPLASLRMTLDALGEGMDADLRARMGEAFDYMEKLTGDYLADATGAEDDAGPEGAKEGAAEAEPYPLGLILRTVWQMFSEEAVSKGLRLRVVESALETRVPPIVLMRIVSNLVSNGVKYTREGGVVAGVRRRGDGAEIRVRDSGPGMTAAELEAFREEGRKGSESEGHGLGLAVCFGLAAAHGLELTVRSAPGRGTEFRLAVPVSPWGHGCK